MLFIHQMWHINSLYMLLYTLSVGITIGTIYTSVFDIYRAFHCNSHIRCTQ